MNTQTLSLLSHYLSAPEIRRLRNAANDVTNLELNWSRKLSAKFQELENLILSHLEKYHELPPPSQIDFTEFYMLHSLEVMRQGFDSAYSAFEKVKPLPSRTTYHFAVEKRGKGVPRTLGELMSLWDYFRKLKKVPKRQQSMADRVKKAYLKKVQSVWAQNAEAFREGTAGDQYEARRAIREASYATYSRAKMIVETETTYYYNQVRRNVYDESPDVTHYLFVAIRDSATTHWCKSRNGVVFKKGTVLLEKNVPPCHWNCRSEIIPLTAQNPRHLALIQNTSLWAENRTLAPLPEGWDGSRGKIA